MNSIAILVVTYNRKHMLLENINAILNQSYKEFDYYVIDNASTDGTEDYVKKIIQSDKRLHYIKLNNNYGGAGGFSFGLNYALCHNYAYSWIMDDDAIPEADALKILVDTADKLGKDNFSFLASNVLWKDRTPCLMNVCIPSKMDKGNSRQKKTDLMSIDYASFVGCFVNNIIAEKVGLPISEFFIYMDDIEYTLRLKAECQAYFVKDSVIIHKMPVNSNAGIEMASDEKMFRFSCAYRNRVYCYRYRWKMGEIKIVLLYILESYRVLRVNPDKKWKRIKIIWDGYRSGRKFKPEIQYANESRLKQYIQEQKNSRSKRKCTII